MCDDYIGGLAISSDGLHVVAAAADGFLSLLDARKSGQVVARVTCGCPLRSLVLDQDVVLAGTCPAQPVQTQGVVIMHEK